MINTNDKRFVAMLPEKCTVTDTTQYFGQEDSATKNDMLLIHNKFSWKNPQ